ncbi:MAG: hypothetical protein KF708_01710 [Pirellulales bacterium]|nr:hypothetical protein [Pirellulales bacterium]
MAKTRLKSDATAPTSEGGFTETRVDAPHVLRTASELQADATVAAPVTPTGQGAEQVAPAVNLAVAEFDLRAPLEQHARQLGEHLAERQRELDRRESQLNAAHAELDSHWRNSRLWFQERTQELAEKETELDERATRLDARQTQLDERAQQLATSESAHTAACRRAGFDAQLREQDLTRQMGELTAASDRLRQQEALLAEARANLEHLRRDTEQSCLRERQQLDQQRAASLEQVRLALANLERRRAAIETEAARVEQWRREPSPQQLTMAKELAAWENRLEAQERRLVSEEQLCERHLTELQGARQAAEGEREELQEQLKLERQRLVTEQRRAAKELEQQRRRFADEAAELDGRREALEQMRADLNQVHRESLEMRLATEELWAQLSGSVAPAMLNQSLARIRARLGDHHRLALSELGERRAELERLRTELTQLQEQLATRKLELQEWATARQAEFDRQTEQLAARQSTLAASEAEVLEASQQWERQRLAQQQEIRRLAAALRRAESAVAA